MQKIEIDKNTQLFPGDEIELHFKSIGGVWLKAVQLYLLEKKLQKRPDFEVLSWSLYGNDKVVFRVRIKDQKTESE